jgi:predicted DNA-binding ribbon-helix-helix protein
MKWFYVFVCPMKTKLTFSPVSAPDRNSRIPHSPILKRSIKLNGKKTSISLEGQFWIGLREIACAENIPLYSLIERIETDRTRRNRSSSIRLFVLDHFRGSGDRTAE